MNSDVHIDARVEDLNWDNARVLLEGIDLFLDGTDNFDTRYVLNDLSIETSIPWIYGACVGSYGLVLPVLRGDRKTPCLRCVLGDAPPPGTSPTCDTAGVLGTMAAVVASIQSTETIKVLLGRHDLLLQSLGQFDIWNNTRSVNSRSVTRSNDRVAPVDVSTQTRKWMPSGAPSFTSSAS